jgi:hypothetical protein
MTDTERAIMRNGPYEGEVRLARAEDAWLWYERSEEFGRLGAVYQRTAEVAQLVDGGPAVVFTYIAEDIPTAIPE